MKPHKHKDLIIAWANGAEIQYKARSNGEWIDCDMVCWNDVLEYRIKPEPKPDVVETFLFVYEKGLRCSGGMKSSFADANLALTFDGETGELKSAEVLK